MPEQRPIFYTPNRASQSPTIPFFDKLNELLAKMGFDAYLEQICLAFYDERM